MKGVDVPSHLTGVWFVMPSNSSFEKNVQKLELNQTA